MTAYFSGKEPSFSVRLLHDRVYELLAEDKRLDGRTPKDIRKIDIKTNVIEKAEGSAMVSMGGTRVIAGVKSDIGQPFSDRPNEGVFTVNAELLPLASKSFEPGPPSQEGVELARIVDRSVRESRAIDLEKLCLIPGQKAYVIFVDFYVLDYDGNYFDPSVLAAVAALSTAKLPKYEVVNGQLEKKEETFSISLRTTPVSVTIGLIKDKMLVDPSLAEQSSLDTSLVATFDSEGNICSVQKNSSGYIPMDLMKNILTVAKERTDFVRGRFTELVKVG